VSAGDRSADRLLGARCGRGWLRSGRRSRRERGANRADTLADRAGHALPANDLHAVRRSPVIDLLGAVTAGAGFVRAGPGEGRLGRLSANCAAHDRTVADPEQNENPRRHPLRLLPARVIVAVGSSTERLTRAALVGWDRCVGLLDLQTRLWGAEPAASDLRLLKCR